MADMKKCNICGERDATDNVNFSCFLDLSECKWSERFSFVTLCMCRDDDSEDMMKFIHMQLCSICKKSFVEAVHFWLSQCKLQNIDAPKISEYGSKDQPECSCCGAATYDIRYLRFYYSDSHLDFPSFKKGSCKWKPTRVKEEKLDPCWSKEKTIKVYEPIPFSSKSHINFVNLGVCKTHRGNFIMWMEDWLQLVCSVRIDEDRFSM
jgi:hypothetical protein